MPDDISATSGPLTLRAGLNDTLTAVAGETYLLGGRGNDVLYAGPSDNGNHILVGGAGRDHLYDLDGHSGENRHATLFLIEKASDLVEGEVYQGDPNGEPFGIYNTALAGAAIAEDASLVGITLANISTIFGFSGALTLTKGQLAALDTVDVGTVALSEGGVVQLADMMAADLRLADGGSSVTFVAATVRHNQGYGTYLAYDTGVQAGFDVLGGDGNDLISGVGAGYIFNTVVTVVDLSLTGAGGNDTLIGEAGNDSLFGGSGGDNINGGYGDDVIKGGNGADFIFASRGADTISGGKGADVFVIDPRNGTSDDVIRDFSGLGTLRAGDVLQFEGVERDPVYLGKRAFTETGALEVRFAQGALKIDFNGDGEIDASLLLTGMTAASDLTQADFL